jgi:RimJ/RimL family protein N-acetyltransferase
MNKELNVREINETDIAPIVAYWTEAPEAYLKGMGIDTSDLSRFDGMPAGMTAELEAAYPEKKTLHLVAELDGEAIGHTYVNDVRFGEVASIHLHLWRNAEKGQGLGSRMVALALPVFFEKLELKKIICEAAAKNPAPNRTMARLGFTFMKTYVTVPAGWNFELEVSRWEMSREQFADLYA